MKIGPKESAALRMAGAAAAIVAGQRVINYLEELEDGWATDDAAWNDFLIPLSDVAQEAISMGTRIVGVEVKIDSGRFDNMSRADLRRAIARFDLRDEQGNPLNITKDRTDDRDDNDTLQDAQDAVAAAYRRLKGA